MEYPGSLHNHTDYSNTIIRDSINRYNELIDYAIELGHNVIAFTEHDCVSNAIKIEEYYEKIKKDHPDFKVIRGNEIYLCRNGLSSETFVSGQDRYWHFVLLAKDAIGHEQIRELSTRAWGRSYITQKMRRRPTYYQDLRDIIEANPGHVIGSTACLGGFLPTQILKKDELLEQPIKDWCLKLQNIFGKDNFFLEMQPSNSQEQIYVNKKLLELSKELDIPYIITTDSHYKCKEEAPIHKAFLNAQDGEREVDSFYATTYMMNTQEIESFFSYMENSDIQKAYENITMIKDMCEDYSLLKSLKIPELKWIMPDGVVFQDREFYTKVIPYLGTFYNSNFCGDRVLADAVIAKIKSDDRLKTKEIYDEINENLAATWISSEVNKAHWSSYFLNLQNIINVCWNAGTLVGPGRGSGVGFLLLYILDIIQINCKWETTKTFGWRLTQRGLKASYIW